MTTYGEKLKDPRWQKLRLEVFERDEFRCHKCSNEKSTLHVHHRYYERAKDPWEYPLKALVTLCDECHEEESRIWRLESENLIRELGKKGFDGGDLLNLMIGVHEMAMISTAQYVAEMLGWAFSDQEVMMQLAYAYEHWLKTKGKAVAS